MVSIVVCTNKDGMQHWKELEGDIDIHTYTFTGHGISFNSCVHKQGRCVTLLAISGRGHRHTHIHIQDIVSAMIQKWLIFAAGYEYLNLTLSFSTLPTHFNKFLGEFSNFSQCKQTLVIEWRRYLLSSDTSYIIWYPLKSAYTSTKPQPTADEPQQPAD